MPPDNRSLVTPSTEYLTEIRSSVVGVLTAFDQHVRPIGMGLLLEIAGLRFVVTARHVAEQMRESNSGGCTGDGHRGVNLDGAWKLSHPTPDIAVNQISSASQELLRSKRYVRVIDFISPKASAPPRYTIMGCPQVWSKGATAPALGQMGEITLVTPAYTGETSGVDDYDPKIHLLLEADPAGLTINAEPWTFTTESGHPLEFPRDLRGISGAPVWTFDDPSGGSPRVVGIQTGVYHEQGLIKVTKISYICHFLRERFPELREALDLALP